MSWLAGRGLLPRRLETLRLAATTQTWLRSPSSLRLWGSPWPISSANALMFRRYRGFDRTRTEPEAWRLPARYYQPLLSLHDDGGPVEELRSLAGESHPETFILTQPARGARPYQR